MAKLSSYTRDTSITALDKLAGSSYVGLINGVPKYQTSSYTIEDLGKYFSENIVIGGSEYDIVSISYTCPPMVIFSEKYVLKSSIVYEAVWYFGIPLTSPTKLEPANLSLYVIDASFVYELSLAIIS